MKCFGLIECMFECIKKWCEICLELMFCLIFIVGFLGEMEEDF